MDKAAPPAFKQARRSVLGNSAEWIDCYDNCHKKDCEAGYQPDGSHYEFYWNDRHQHDDA
jgi:hypothetical protein